MERANQDRLFFLVLTFCAIGTATLFYISFHIAGDFTQLKAKYETWCPRTSFGLYNPYNRSAGVLNKTAPLFMEFKTPESVKEFCAKALS